MKANTSDWKYGILRYTEERADDLTNSALDFKDKLRIFFGRKIGGMANPDPNKKDMQHRDEKWVLGVVNSNYRV